MDMTTNIFLQKGCGQGHVTPNFPTPPLFEDIGSSTHFVK